MRYRYIVIIGFSVISIFFTLAMLMYYFNQNKCPVGTFSCTNTTSCIPQKFWCNGEENCLYGDDETDCVDLNGFNDWILELLIRKAPNATCDHSNAPLACTYIECRANCSGYMEIPNTISENITNLNFTSNFIKNITVNSLSNYPKLDILHLGFNKITILEKHAFKNQKDLIFLVLRNNYLENIHAGQFYGLVNLNTLLLDNNKLISADFLDFANSTSLSWINLNHNFLREQTLKFPYLPALEELSLNDNLLQFLPSDLFEGLSKLRNLHLEDNNINIIDFYSFLRIGQLTELVLSFNNISEIPSNAFNSLENLQKLAIGNNPINNVPLDLFLKLSNLQSLGLEDIDLDKAEQNMFNALPNLTFIYFKKFYYCTTYAPMVPKCYPASDGLSSLSDLLGKQILRIAVWSISSVTFIGNLLVLWERFTAKDDNQVLSIFIRNLALSDMLMGFYLFIIAFKDLRYRDSYNDFASSWMSSNICSLVGIIAMISSQVSMMILSFLSVERFILITAPLKRKHFMSARTTSTSMFLIWAMGFCLAFFPAAYWRNSTRFYGANGMCFPLHIDDPFFIGWEYSAFIFLGLNVISLAIIIYVYFSMFISIYKTRCATTLSVRDSEFALRFFLIIFTNLICWTPIIVLKILALMNYPAAPDLHAWIVVFILPINSAVNPILYTFTTPKFRERFSFECSKSQQNSVPNEVSIHQGTQL